MPQGARIVNGQWCGIRGRDRLRDLSWSRPGGRFYARPQAVGGFSIRTAELDPPRSRCSSSTRRHDIGRDAEEARARHYGTPAAAYHHDIGELNFSRAATYMPGVARGVDVQRCGTRMESGGGLRVSGALRHVARPGRLEGTSDGCGSDEPAHPVRGDTELTSRLGPVQGRRRLGR